MPEGEERKILSTPENGLPPEIRRLQVDVYPQAEKDLIEELMSAEIKEDGDISELSVALFDSLAFQEGLEWGVKDYDLGSKEQLSKLQAMFTTVETSTKRERAYYLEPAINKALNGRIREAKEYQNNPDLWKKKKKRELKSYGFSELQIESFLKDDGVNKGEEIKKVEVLCRKDVQEKIYSLINHCEARGIIDKAFVQRQQTTQTEDAGAGLLEKDRFGYPSVSPDKEHWEGFFKGEFGDLVDKVLREMVKVAYVPGAEGVPGYIKEGDFYNDAIPRDIYAKNMEDTNEFHKWLDHMLKIAKGRMDVVWNAWKVFCVTELISEFGKKVDTKGKIHFGNSPLMSSLFTWLIHLEDKRGLEFGLNHEGIEAVRNNQPLSLKHLTQIEKYISHSGLPLTLGKFGVLLRSYLFEAKVVLPKEDSNGNPVPGDTKTESLFNLWWGKDGNRKGEGGTGISFAASEFPWRKTEDVIASSTPGEPPQGSFELWLLQRMRAWGVVEDIRSRPSMKDLADPDFFVKRLRNWCKVKKNIEIDKDKPPVPPEKNPRAWMLLAWVRYHTAGTKSRAAIINDNPELDYRTLQRNEEFGNKTASSNESKPQWGDVFWNAQACGWVRKEDIEWILKQASIKLYT